jgi:hypothetical protein
MIPPKEIIYAKGDNGINISHSLGCFVFTPPKTGSTTAAKIFNNFDFQTFKISDTNNIQLFSNQFTQTHYYHNLPDYENYKLICTVRNPYSKFVSLFKYTIAPEKKVISTYNWREEFFELLFDNITHHSDQGWAHELYFGSDLSSLGRKIDYPLRIENLFEDYSSIPFIKDSDYFKNGSLKKDLDLKLNSTDDKYDYSLYKIPNKWEDFYDRSTADFVYSKHKSYFDYFGYDKDSWKKI